VTGWRVRKGQQSIPDAATQWSVQGQQATSGKENIYSDVNQFTYGEATRLQYKVARSFDREAGAMMSRGFIAALAALCAAATSAAAETPIERGRKRLYGLSGVKLLLPRCRSGILCGLGCFS
jgi:hypothetical protein